MEAASGIAGKAIMVVEDEYLVALNLVLVLVEEGAVVEGQFSRVEDALQALERGARPNAAVLDINVAGRLVFPVAERLAALSVPFVFATGYDRRTVPPAFSRIERLEKPADPGRLVKALSALVADAGRTGAA